VSGVRGADTEGKAAVADTTSEAARAGADARAALSPPGGEAATESEGKAAANLTTRRNPACKRGSVKSVEAAPPFGQHPLGSI
jgi:hypothetical protein